MRTCRIESISGKSRFLSFVPFLLLFCGMLYGGELFPFPDGSCPAGYRPVTRRKTVNTAGGTQEEETYTVCLPLTAEQHDALMHVGGLSLQGGGQAPQQQQPQPRQSTGGQGQQVGGNEQAQGGGQGGEAYSSSDDDGAQVTSEGASVNLQASIEIHNDTQYKLYTNMDYRKRIIIVSSRNDGRFNKWWVLNYEPQIFRNIPTGRTVLYCSRGHTHTITVYEGELVKFYAEGCRFTTNRGQ